MGLVDWLRGGRREADPPAPPPSLAEQLLAELDRAEQLTGEGRVPPIVTARVRRVTGTVRETIPRLDSLGAGSPQAYSVMATATDYLPDALSGYLRLPREWADTRPLDRGKSALLLLVDQLDLLGATMDKVYDAVCRMDAEALLVHGEFLAQKFGTGSVAHNLNLPENTPLPGQPSGPLTPPD